MDIRRVVTVNRADGISDFALDGSSPRKAVFKSVPGFELSMLWTEPVDFKGENDPVLAESSWAPDAAGSRVLLVTFPPDSVMSSEGFDPAAAGAEYLDKLPGLAEKFEPENPGMHTTKTVDYGFVVDGEIHLELDDGRTKVLKKNDFIVQNGTRHAWRNPGTKSATVLFVMIAK